jgi:hypothetical protein
LVALGFLDPFLAVSFHISRHGDGYFTSSKSFHPHKFLSSHKGSIPLGCLAIASILLVWPRTPGLPLSSWAAFQSIDFFGIFLILAASVMHIWAFESVSIMTYEWTSPLIISLLVLAASCWVIFVSWQLFLETRKNTFMKPVFPFRIVTKRVMASAVL